MKKLKTNKLKRSLSKDIVASFVVFLVALPLSMGIAIASGVPPARGLVTGIIGGIVVGTISGSALQVSGPAAGLAVIVAELVQNNGIEMLGPVILLAGLIQLLAGVFKFGKIFRAISPAVIYGMLAGIGVLIFASQFHVMLKEKPRATGIENLISIPISLYHTFFDYDNISHLMAAAIGVTTLIVLLLWDKFKPRSLKLIPGALIAVVVASTLANLFHLPIPYVDLPANLTEVIQVPTPANLIRLINPPLLISAAAIAFIASAESLLSAAAVDRLHQGSKTDFDRELAAQGFGNMVCGALGVLPMTGVIVRSSVNVKAGAKTRLSAILHGVWILVLVVAAPGLLKMIPMSSLAAILVVTGYKLVEVENIRKLKQYGRVPVVIFFATFIGIVAADLLTGVLIGIVLTTIALIYKISYLNIYLERDEKNRRIDIHIEGTATFIRLPKMASVLEQMPADTELYVHLENLAYIDHSCLDWLSMWAEQQQQRGNTVTIHWDRLEKRFRRPFQS
ncbi:SulP family inorganic anion transporter [Brasilonema bromeliae]|uniref:SulP family inorganic anion transporter n=1 Tax=Brasilonema bromeliae SPC951 TaxID=385972 RepID=A0ABX1PC25_9CYAN|nr:SulP family inorganic anion transporter [Brasilonema bromeliae]NMG21513.1 SulP family inorganic anion transporter [Brasilonema bromeliae SPC951]